MPFHLPLLLHDTMALITILNPIAAASIMISLIGSDATSATIQPQSYFRNYGNENTDTNHGTCRRSDCCTIYHFRGQRIVGVIKNIYLLTKK